MKLGNGWVGSGACEEEFRHLHDLAYQCNGRVELTVLLGRIDEALSRVSGSNMLLLRAKTVVTTRLLIKK